jgi:TRAP-type mannitol/chloroaromatic compound transport system substrate-binding protein
MATKLVGRGITLPIVIAAICSASPALSQVTAKTPGAAAIERLLIETPNGWTSVWTPTDAENWEMPAGTGLARFERRGGKVYEVFENHLLGQRCENEVVIHDDGVTRFGCTRVPKRLRFDPADPDIPFRGSAVNGYSYRLISNKSHGTSDDAIRWSVPIAFPTNYPAQGDGVLYVTRMLARVSADRFVIQPQRGRDVAPAAITQAVREGKAEAGYAWLAFDQERMPAAALFSSMPFGMEPWEFAAWWFEGGGSRLAEELYAPLGLHPILCGIAGPEAAGWYRREVNTAEDFRGLRMRFGTGLARKIVQRLGVTTVSLPDYKAIMAAFEQGVIDAAEHSTPAVDATRPFATLVKNYYFPGWHQSLAALHLVVNRDVWAGLPPPRQAQLELACTAATLRTIATAEAVQGQALERIKGQGVTLRRLPESVLRALREAADEVLRETAEADPAFRRILDSQRAFRSTHAEWKRLGYLPRDF